MGFKPRQKQRYGPVIKAVDMREEYFADGRVWEWRNTDTILDARDTGARIGVLVACDSDGWVRYYTNERRYRFRDVDTSDPTEEWREVLRG